MRSPNITSLFAIVLMFVTVSCIKPEGGVEPSVEESRVPVLFFIEREDAVPTKALSESSLERVDVLVFRTGFGILDSHLTTESQVFTVSVPKDVEVEWHIIGNAPAGFFDGVSTIDSFNELYSHLADNASPLCCMTASSRSTFSDESTRSVTLERLVSRVWIGDVQPDYYATSSFTVTRVFLLNVVEGLSFDAERISGLWYNKLVREPYGGPSCLSRDVAKSNDSDVIEVGEFLYCFPNPTIADTDSSIEPLWSARHTRLVIEAQADGTTEYYPITLPVMRRNTTYRVNKVIITGPGSHHPDIPVDRTALETSITITPWESTNIDVPLE